LLLNSGDSGSSFNTELVYWQLFLLDLKCLFLVFNNQGSYLVFSYYQWRQSTPQSNSSYQPWELITDWSLDLVIKQTVLE